MRIISKVCVIYSLIFDHQALLSNANAVVRKYAMYDLFGCVLRQANRLFAFASELPARYIISTH